MLLLKYNACKWLLSCYATFLSESGICSESILVILWLEQILSKMLSNWKLIWKVFLKIWPWYTRIVMWQTLKSIRKSAVCTRGHRRAQASRNWTNNFRTISNGRCSFSYLSQCSILPSFGQSVSVFNQQETMCDMSSCTIANDRQFLDSVDTLSFWILSCQKNDRGCKLNFRFNFCATGLVTHEKIALQFQMFAVWNCGLKWRGSYHKWAASCETQYVL